MFILKWKVVMKENLENSRCKVEKKLPLVLLSDRIINILEIIPVWNFYT